MFGFWLLIAIGFATLIYANAKNKQFNLIDLVMTNDKADPARLGYVAAMCISTWGFWALMAEGKMTEWYFGGYILGFVGGGAISRIGVKSDEQVK